MLVENIIVGRPSTITVVLLLILDQVIRYPFVASRLADLLPLTVWQLVKFFSLPGFFNNVLDLALILIWPAHFFELFSDLYLKVLLRLDTILEYLLYRRL